MALTVLGEVFVLTIDPFPSAAAEEADLIDHAFRVLMVLGIPVLAFVMAALIYVIPRFRRRGLEIEDGPPIRSHGVVIAIWLLVTTVLTVVLIIYPGAIGFGELRARAQEEPDLVVQVEGSRWFWKIGYPEYGINSSSELVVPVGKKVRFDVTAVDVLHSFWVPAFRMKIDAVPGMVTTVHVTPDETGAYEDNSALRLQCSELCGLFHSKMTTPVRVVEQEEFEAWVAQQARNR